MSVAHLYKFTVEAVTATKLAAMQQSLVTDYGMKIGLPSGPYDPGTLRLTGHGITADIHLDTPTSVLTVTIINHPIYADPEVIEKKLRAKLASS